MWSKFHAGRRRAPFALTPMATHTENQFNANFVESGTVRIVFALENVITPEPKKQSQSVTKSATNVTISF